MYISGLAATPPDCPVDSTDPTCIAAWQAYGTTTGDGGGTCPGSPGCPGYVPPPASDWQSSMLEAILANQLAIAQAGAGTTPAPTTQAASSLNASTVALIAAGAVVLFLLARR